MSLLKHVLAVVGCLAVHPAARAQLVAYDPFNQAPTTQMIGTASVGVPWPGPGVWQQAFAVGSGNGVVSPGLSYGPLLTTGNRAVIARVAGNPGAAGVVRPLGANFGGLGTTLWISMLTDAISPDAGLTLTSGGSALVTMGTSSGGDNFGLSLAPSATGTGSSLFVPASPVVAPTSVRFLAMRLDFTAGGPVNSIELFVNPDMSSLGAGLAPTGAAVASFGAALPFTFDAVTLANAATIFNAVGFDEIRIGTTWADVSPVPEPTAWVLLAGPAGWAWLARRRRGPAQSGAQP